MLSMSILYECYFPPPRSLTTSSTGTYEGIGRKEVSKINHDIDGYHDNIDKTLYEPHTPPYATTSTMGEYYEPMNTSEVAVVYRYSCTSLGTLLVLIETRESGEMIDQLKRITAKPTPILPRVVPTI